MLPLLLLLGACSQRGPDSDSRSTGATNGPTPPNVLIVVADDLGVDHVNAWGIAPETPPQPTLDALAADGVRFTNAWAASRCSPTRASLLTGRYGRRTGAIDLIGFANSWYELPLDEVLLPEMLAEAPQPWATSAVGKWHLASVQGLGAEHPLLQGFDWHAGSPGNLDVNTLGGDTDYFRWEKWDNGQTLESTTYATTDTVDDALGRAAVMPEPWLLYVAFNAPHYPMHVPPAHLHSDAGLTEDSGDPRKFDALVEAFDTELGRLLDGIDPDVLSRTTVVVVGDNGTPRSTITAPFDGSKGKQTPYELGVRVPLIVTGAGVDGDRDVDALVHVVDLFPTLADWAGVELEPLGLTLDGHSLAPWIAGEQGPERTHVYNEQASPNGGPDYPIEDIRFARDPRFKLIRFPDHDEFYDLEATAFGEGDPISDAGAAGPEAQAAWTALDAFLGAQEQALVYEGPERPPLP